MNSKKDRLDNSIDNMQVAIDYYLKDVENKFPNNRKVLKDLLLIKNILTYFKTRKSFENNTLTEIRRINLSVMSLYEDGDYNVVFSEIMKTNNDLCRDDKDKDMKILGDFKRIFSGLPNYYKYRLSKAELSPTEGLCFRDKKLDNFKFIIEKYLSVKYNFAKIKYEVLEISDSNQSLIDKYSNVIEMVDDNNIKDISSKIIAFITNFAKAEIIITNLEKIKELCVNREFLNIKDVVDGLLEKYMVIYNINKEKNETIVQNIDLEKYGLSSAISINDDIELEQNDYNGDDTYKMV